LSSFNLFKRSLKESTISSKMNFAHILAFFFLVGAATSSPIQSRDVEPQPYWIIEAISEGDFSKALEILEDHVTHLVETGKNIGEISLVAIRHLIEKIRAMPMDEKTKAVVEKWIQRILKKVEDIKKKIQDAHAKHRFMTVNEKYSLIEDLKEVINQIKNQVGGIISTGGNIKDIIDNILG